MGKRILFSTKHIVLFVFFFLVETAICQSLKVDIPADIYLSEGVEYNIYYQNILPYDSTTYYKVEATCEIGKAHDDKWTCIPSQLDIGEHTLSLSFRDNNGVMLATREINIHVTDSQSQAILDTIRILFIGNSLTERGIYEKKTAELLLNNNITNFVTLGSFRKDGVTFEGRGGWKWELYAYNNSSPFLFFDGIKKELNFKKYVDSVCAGIKPNVVVFELGINELFHLNPNDTVLIEKEIDKALKCADLITGKLHAAFPHAKIGICTIPPACLNDSAYWKLYSEEYNYRRWKSIQFQGVMKYNEHFKNNDMNISLLPLNISMDAMESYTNTDPVHPNNYGYQQMANVMYSWIRYLYNNSLITSVYCTQDNGPEHFVLLQNYPNPFNSFTKITYELPGETDVELDVFNTLGSEILAIKKEGQKRGSHSIPVDMSNYPSGVYYYRFIAGSFTVTRKMLLLK